MASVLGFILFVVFGVIKLVMQAIGYVFIGLSIVLAAAFNWMGEHLWGTLMLISFGALLFYCYIMRKGGSDD